MEVTFPLLAIELSLLAGALLILGEWFSRRITAVSSVRLLRAEVGTVLVFSAALFFVLWGQFFYAYGFLALALALGISVSLFFPLGALAFFVQLLLLRPWELSSHPLILSLPKIFAALTVCVWGYHKVYRRDDKIVVTPALISFTALLVWLIVSGFALGRGEITIDFLSKRCIPVFVLFGLLLQLPLKKGDLSFLLRVVIFGMCGLAIASIGFTYAESFELSSQSRLTFIGLFGNSNDLASLFVVIFPFLIAPLLSGKEPFQRRLFVVFPLVLITLGIWLTQSRGAFLSLFCMGLVWLALKRGGKKWTALPLLCIPILLSVFVFRSSGDLDGSSTSRWNYVVTGLYMLKSSPIFGIGVGQYTELYELFTPEFTEWGKRTAHSSWVLIMAEGGVIGLLLFGLVFGYSLRAAYHIRHTHPQFLLSIVGYGVSMSLLSHTYIFLPYLLFGLVGAASRLYRPRLAREIQKNSVRSLRARFRFPLLQRFGLFSIVLLAASPVCAELRVIPDLDKPFGEAHKKLATSLILSGSRGETLNYFVRLPKGELCSSLVVKLTQKNGKELRSLSQYYYLPYIKTEHPSYPKAPVGNQLDATVPIGVNKVCLSKGGASWILGEIAIQENASPGMYSGSLQFGPYTLPVEIEVWKMKIPEEPTFPIYSEMTTWYNLLGHYGKWHDGEAELAKKYLQTLRAHRIEILSARVADPKLEITKEGPVFNIRTHPTPDQSLYAVNIVGRPDWAYMGLPTVPIEKVGTTESLQYLQAAQNSLADYGAFARKNSRGSGKTLFYLWDEPQPEDRETFRRLLIDADRYAPDITVLVTTPYERSLDSLIDIFVPVAEEIGGRFPSADDYQPLRKRGKEFWWYVSCMSHGCGALGDTGSPDLVIDRPSVYVRSVGWVGPLLKTDAFLYYHVNYAYQFYPERDPWKNQWDFSGNGDGTLLYPGRPGEHGLTEHQPIASLRLKSLRQASFDAQYIAWMEQLENPPVWWEDTKQALVSGFLSWERDFWKFSEVRKRVGGYLHRRK